MKKSVFSQPKMTIDDTLPSFANAPSIRKKIKESQDMVANLVFKDDSKPKRATPRPPFAVQHENVN